MRRLKTFMGLCLLLMPISLIMWVWIPGLWKVTLSLVMFWGFGALIIAEEEPEPVYDDDDDPLDLFPYNYHIPPPRIEDYPMTISQLRRSLKQAIECEDFETAALIRDKIKERK